MQLLRNALGLPYHRGRRRAAPPPEPMTLEDIVTTYKATKAEHLYKIIMEAAKPLFVARGVPEQDAKQILSDCLNQFDLFSGLPFLRFVASALERKFQVIGVDAEKLEAASYRQNGFFSFEEFRAGHPEMLAVARTAKAEMKQAAADKWNETETEPEPVNSSDQDESEPETAPEADQDETEPETTPEPERDPYGEFQEMMMEIISTW